MRGCSSLHRRLGGRGTLIASLCDRRHHHHQSTATTTRAPPELHHSHQPHTPSPFARVTARHTETDPRTNAHTLTHTRTLTAACYQFWKTRSLDDRLIFNPSEAHTRMDGPASGYSPSLQESLDLQMQRLCMCCSHSQLQSCCKQVCLHECFL